MFNKVTFLIEYFKFLKNPFEALQFKFGLKKECIIKIKNTNLKIKLRHVESLNKLMKRIPTTNTEKYYELIEYIADIENNKEVVKIGGINYINIYNKSFIEKNPTLFNICNEEYFSDDQWNMINFKNRYIIDIGANVGDTALYFAENHAKVIAFEPVIHLYELGLKNLSLNPKLKRNIKFINKAVGGKRGKLDISKSTTKTYVSTESYQIDVITVSDILTQYNFPPDILKMDCEGCEFEIIQNEDLSMFNDVIFEHHSQLVGKDYRPLIKILEKQGFKINTYKVNTSRAEFEDIGIIHAYKIK